MQPFSISHHLPAPRVALVTSAAYVASQAAEGDWYLGNILQDDGLLIRELASLGIQADRVAWSDPEVDWGSYQLAILRSTWDYFDRFHEFSVWLDKVNRHTRLCNPLPTLRWNVDKHYLRDLEKQGISVIPTRFLEKGCTFSCLHLLSESETVEVVIKPCISGAARHTYRVNRQNYQQVEEILIPLVQQEAFMVQPFQQDIVETGEDTIMVINGQATHAVRKIAKPGDFRVQDDHGGTVIPYQATSEQITLARQTMEACPDKILYGRVDMVRGNDGRLVVMEAEVIEPELWLRFHPPAAAEFATAIAVELQ